MTENNLAILRNEASDEIARLTAGAQLGFFTIVDGFELEVLASGRPEWIAPIPAPRCKLAARKDTKAWFVATGVYFKPLESIDDTTFRDSDGCTWRLHRAALAAQGDDAQS